MIRAVIIDDERGSRDTLRSLLERHCTGVSIVAEANNVFSAADIIRAAKPDLLFLDISMPDGSGFDLLDQLGDPFFETIFVTAYNEFAIKAIKSRALDYLLKPIDISDLQAAVTCALKVIDQKQNIIHPEPIKVRSNAGSIAIPVSTGLQFVKTGDIIHLTANGNYTEFHFIDGSRLTSSYTLSEYENTLPEDLFFRIHHSEIINLQHIKQYHKGDSNGYVIMVNDIIIQVSRRKKKQFLELFSFIKRL